MTPGRSERFDVVVVGGGPSATAAAILCADSGLRTVLLERRQRLIAQPGETLHPGVEPLLVRLGVFSSVLDACTIRHNGITHRHPGGTTHHPYGADRSGPWRGLQIQREALNEILLSRAEDVGVVLCLGQSARFLLADSEGIPQGVETSDGRFLARNIIDGTGAARWLAAAMSIPVRQRSPRLIARYGYCICSPDHPVQPPEFGAVPFGWDWTARVSPQRYAWVRVYAPELGEPEVFTPRSVRGLEPDGPTRGEDVSWKAAASVAGPGFFMVGDAAVSLDPSSSHGVLRALMTGMMAAHAVKALHARSASAAEAAAHYQTWLLDAYRQESQRLRLFYDDLLPQLSWRAALK